jgi:D-serine deaminase-like pyridoxal phosphate-dependent protein
MSRDEQLDAADVQARLGALAERPAVCRALELLGLPGSRRMLPTPAALVDRAALDANLARAADAARAAGVALRPHAKTHKSAALACRQRAAGAQGVCVAKLGEAEALAAAGVDDLLVTSPIVDEQLAVRAVALAAAGTRLAVTVDHPAGVDALVRTTAGTRAPVLEVLIDVDVGLHRTGVADPEAAVRLAASLDAASGLVVRGVQGYGGHWQHVPDPAKRQAAVADGMHQLTEVVEALDALGHDTRVRTGGGTGTFDDDLALGVLTELQPGSYAVMDEQYRVVRGGWTEQLRQALFVAATVTRAAHSGWLTLDAGLKAFATDADVPVTALGSYVWFGDEQGMLLTDCPDRPAVGERIELSPPHCDPTIDRYDLLHVVQDDTLVDLWPVQARGRSA